MGKVGSVDFYFKQPLKCHSRSNKGVQKFRISGFVNLFCCISQSIVVNLQEYKELPTSMLSA